ncbi:MAG TPA: hypothetical protein VFW47_05485 [Phenylobacterium sp.]|nr:hypothetical protein [Phenylobacterium sp.]
MSAEYSTFARPAFTSADFGRDEVESDGPMFATPIYARDRAARPARSGIHPAVWVAVPAVILAVGAGAYFMSQRGEPTVAATRPIPAAASPAMQPTELMASTAQPMAPPVVVTEPAPVAAAPAVSRQPAPTRTARVAPARRVAAPSPTGVDASASIPSTPQPYSGSAAAPAPVVSPPTPTVAAEPVTPAPEAVTPPVAPQAPEATVTPPTA